MSKVEVDFGLCESNGVCMGIIPEVFDLDDQDYLHVLQDGSARGRRSSFATSDERAETNI
jgi:ferredoxin